MLTENPPIQIYINRIENRFTFKIKTGYHLELSTPQTMNLLGSSKKRITKAKQGENIPRLKVTEVVFIHCNLINNAYQYESRVLCTFTPKKPFGTLINILPSTFIFMETVKSEFLHVNGWFADQNFKPLELQDRINLTLVIT